MKKILFILATTFSVFASSQIKDTVSDKKLYLKANAVFLPVGILNAGLEYQLNRKWTLQGDVFISPWKSFAGRYAQIYMGGVEGRYYFDEAFKHFYVGANLNFAVFKLQKWNYWGGTFQYTPTSPIYDSADLYQQGFAILAGATIGYQWQINEKWNLDLFAGGGHSEGFYKGYHKTLGVRYDTDPTREYNRSGEFLPFKGGLMVSYRLK